MQHLLRLWLIMGVLGVLSLNSVVASLPADVALAHSFEAEPAWTHAHTDQGSVFFKETSSVAHEFSLQSERESKKVRSLVRRADWMFLDHQGDDFGHFDLALLPPPVCFFLPRKLSPPSSADDPFLS